MAIAWNTPIYNALLKYAQSGPTVFHMPGHKLGKGIPEEFLRNLPFIDVTEIPGTDNLHFPTGIIKEAQELAAEAFGSDKTYFLVNGSTCGIHAMILACCKPGDRLIVSRDCHRSVIGGMMLAGVSPIYIKPGFDSEYGIPTAVDPAELEDTLKKHPEAVGVFITRPNYYGICAGIESISRLVHSYGKVLMVDEAHGAHLGFSGRLPASAMEGGADICVQSAHKTLPAFTQGAYLHVKSGRIDIDRLEFYLRTLQTTSPSYIIMAMLDIAREIMATRGRELLDGLLENIGRFRHKLGGCKGLACFSGEGQKEWQYDDTRLTINFGRLGITGFEADRLLRLEHNIQVEMADLNNIVCITTVADEQKDFDRLFEGLAAIDRRFEKVPGFTGVKTLDFEIPPIRLELNEAMNLKGTKISLEKAAGRISRSIVTPYPPGIPVICPGEAITEYTVEFILNIVKAGGTVNGIGDNLEIDVVS